MYTEKSYTLEDLREKDSILISLSGIEQTWLEVTSVDHEKEVIVGKLNESTILDHGFRKGDFVPAHFNQLLSARHIDDRNGESEINVFPGNPSLRLPTRLKIGHINYLVEDESVEESIGKGEYGSITYSSATIRVSRAISDDAKKMETFLHEILHGIFENNGLHEVDPKSFTEELIVDSLSKGMCAVFRDNPVLSKLMFQAFNHNQRLLV